MTEPASPYLLDRLQARRALPTARSRRSDSGPTLVHVDDDLFLSEARSCANNSSTTTPSRTRTPANPTPALGAREMEKRMDKLSKLNFDLKLELFHCRERMAKLQDNCETLASRAATANRLVDENATLLELNDSLIRELEHRDEAVQEAVSIICDLEERLERAQESQPSQLTPSDPSLLPRTVTSSPIPRALISPHKLNGQSSRPPSSVSPQKRIPSFVGEKKPSTRALRSVYLEPTQTLHAIRSHASLASQREDIDKPISEVDALDSPRLSVLSESSFASIYHLRRSNDTDGIKESSAIPASSQLEAFSQMAGRKRDSDSEVNSWIQVQTPQPATHSSEQRQFQQPHPHSHSPQQHTTLPTASSHRRYSKKTSLEGSVFGGALLPPTPDSASTSVLQDSYMAGPSDVKASRRILGSFPNATKHAALLHTPETPSVVDMSKLQIRPDPRRSATGTGRSNRHSISLSSTDEEDEYEQSNSNAGSRTGSAGSDGSYPNGGSILTGTPSRFQVRHNISPANNLLFDGEGIDQISRQQRRNTLGVDTQLLQRNATRHRMERSETTPNLALTPSTSVRKDKESTKASGQRLRRMERSETTPNLSMPMQTSLAASQTDGSFSEAFDLQRQPQATNWSGPIIANLPSRSHTSGGVRAALSQKTHKLLRRMSEHHAGSSEHSRRGRVLSPSKRPGTANSGGSSGEESLAMQTANQAVSSRNLGIAGGAAEVKGPGRGLFWRAAGSVRR